MLVEREAFFIFGAPRSGTTFLATVLNTATNARVFVEDAPKLGYESRVKHLEHFHDINHSKRFIKEQKDANIQQVNNDNYIYGDKNPNFLPFLIEMSEVWPKAKFIFIYRDGRDVVNSLIRWNKSGKKIFQMAEDGVENGAKYPVQDLWDYSRLRPKEGEMYHDNWKQLTLFEKCCIYWNYYNLYALHELSKISTKRTMMVNVSNANVSNYRGLFNFLNLNDFRESTVEEILKRKINTSMSAPASDSGFKRWEMWLDLEKKLYEKYALEAHLKLFKKLKLEIK